ncbi:MAG: glycoside hydrolase family 97 catalytic domain-containing protein [Prevotella sp.]|nr:glycoside hydrolase family 97 catalytic domain-containing protein [Prevotella sp.]
MINQAMRHILSVLCLATAAFCQAGEVTVKSPSGKLEVAVSDDGGKPTYRIALDGKQMLTTSALGLRTSQGNLTEGLTITDSKTQPIEKHYDIRNIKTAHSDYQANCLAVTLENQQKQRLTVTFLVSDNDVAFRYSLPVGNRGRQRTLIFGEATSFNFPDGTTTFLSPQIGPETGWAQTKPSYEEVYTPDAPMTAKSQYGRGYTFPCLFHLPEGWALVSETGTTGSYPGTHISDYEAGRGYTIAFPDKGENGGFGSEFAACSLPAETPWRTITVGQTLKPLVETTVSYDVVEPLYEPSENYKAGRYTWSWLVWQDGATNYDDQVKFIDLAAEMGYEYCLVDALWDTQIGRDRMVELSRYAQSKGVSLMLWYNSNGYANDAPQGPRHCLNTALARNREMKWMQGIGVKGIKVDFFGGDKQETMQLYEDILADANRYGIQVIFHGCTLPRGWERMFPNYVASEAVLASENVFFSEGAALREPFDLTVHPFCRNAVASMDWGGVIMNRYMSRDNKSRHSRKTTDVFEMASGITNQTSVQCVAMCPNNLTELQPFELDFLRQLPSTWDETRFIDGYPGKYVVLARRHGDNWYIAGLNAQKEPLKLTLSLPMFAGQTVSTLVDDKNGAPTLTTQKIGKQGQAKVTIQPNGGIILTNHPK